MEILLFVMILILKQGQIQATAVFLSCPNNTFSSIMDTFFTGWFNSSVLVNTSCEFPVQKVEFVLIKGSVERKICDQDFSTSTVICNTNYNAQNCRCDSHIGTNFSYTLKILANSISIDGDIILQSDCLNSSFQNIFQSQPCSYNIGTTTFPTTTESIPPECENCNCNGTCKCPDNCSTCPVWCIIVISVCVLVGVGLIIVITVIIIKCKKAKKRGNRSPATSSEAGHNRIKLQPITAPSQVENKLTVQDRKEMQDRTKHLGTDNSPEKEKRLTRKKKKPFREDDGESFSREDKSTVSGLNENSPITYSGEFRSLPMPKTPHLTSVERDSTIFQSETPRKLPPLLPKAMIIP